MINNNYGDKKNKKLEFLDVDGNIVEPTQEDVVQFRPGVYCIVKNNQNQVLMIIDSKSNKWEFPGGGLKIGEDLSECGIREIKEETGYSINIIDELPFHIEKNMAYFRTANEFKHKLDLYFLAQLNEETQVMQSFDDGEEILKIEWFDIGKLNKLDIWHRQKEVLEKFLKLN